MNTSYSFAAHVPRISEKHLEEQGDSESDKDEIHELVNPFPPNSMDQNETMDRSANFGVPTNSLNHNVSFGFNKMQTLTDSGKFKYGKKLPLGTKQHDGSRDEKEPSTFGKV